MAEKTTTGRLIAAGGGVLLIASLFLSWYGINVGGTAGQFAGALDTSASGWQSLDIGDLVFLVVGLLAMAPAAFDIFDLEIELPFDVSFVALVGGGISIAWILLRIIDKPGPDMPENTVVDVSIGIKYGIIIALVGAIAIVVGGVKQQNEPDASETAFADPVTGQQYATPQSPPPAAAPPAAAPPAAAPPAPGVPPQAPPAPQAPPPGQQPPPGPPPAV